MTNTNNESQTRKYAGIGDGKIRIQADASTPGAVAREWEVDGSKGVKYELHEDNIEGLIKKVDIFEPESKKFKNLQITFLKETGEEITLSTRLNDYRYTQNIIKKLDGIDFAEPVKFHPYDFTPTGATKKSIGVSVQQDGNKITNAFWDGEKTVLGYPTINFSTASASEKAIFNIQEADFLEKFIREEIIPRVEEVNGRATKVEEPQDADMHIDNVPF